MLFALRFVTEYAIKIRLCETFNLCTNKVFPVRVRVNISNEFSVIHSFRIMVFNSVKMVDDLPK